MSDRRFFILCLIFWFIALPPSIMLSAIVFNPLFG
jgi:hypothetical protein